MTYTLMRTTVLPADLQEVFDVFKNPRNLEAFTPSWLGFRILSTSDEIVREGTRIRYRLSLAGFPISWESRITEYAELSHFADEQLSGPYKSWYHRHTFRAVPGGVEMTDVVEYALPFGGLGRLVHWLVVRHQLRAIFDYRTNVMTDMFCGVPERVASSTALLELGS
ncbi:MAG: SRPBCC family protein [Gemmatimonadales bacterium]